MLDNWLTNGFYYIAGQVCPIDTIPNNQVFESFHAIMSQIIESSVSFNYDYIMCATDENDDNLECSNLANINF